MDTHLKQTTLSGVDAWAFDIRTRMANDPARMDLHDEIQCGYLWIDEYLSQIQTSVTSASDSATNLFELVKTPGRNKGTVKKTRAALQAAQAAEDRLKALNAPRFDLHNKENAAAPQQVSFHDPHPSIRPFSDNNSQNPFLIPSTIATMNTKPAGPRENPKSRPLPPLPPMAQTQSDLGRTNANPPMIRTMSQPVAPVAAALMHPPSPKHIPSSQPAPSAMEIDAQEISVPLNDTKPPKTPGGIFPDPFRKQSYAILPDPSPLRKSMRVLPPRNKEHATEPIAPPPPTVAPPSTNGIRPSWLRGGPRETTWANKPTKTPTVPPPPPISRAGTKRNSDEAGNTASDRATKLFKKDITDVQVSPKAARPPTIEPETRPSDTGHHMEDDDEDDDDTHMLPLEPDEEDTAERIRRLTVKYNVKGFSAEHTLDLRQSGEQLEQEKSEEPRSNRSSREQRLSVSHLVNVFDSKTGKSSTLKGKASTTPPHSPPAQSPPRPAAQPDVFSKPAPFKPSNNNNIFHPPASIFSVPSINKPALANNWKTQAASIFTPKPPTGEASEGANVESQSTVVDSIFSSQQTRTSAATSFQFSQEAPKAAMGTQGSNSDATFIGWHKYQDGDVDDWVRPLPSQPRVSSDGEETDVEDDAVAFVPSQPLDDDDWDDDDEQEEEQPALSQASDDNAPGREERDISKADTTNAGGILSFVKNALPLKSLRMAAAAAEKQKAEQDKKAARMKEMEARRIAVLKKKEEQAKAEEEAKEKERRRKQEEDKRRKELAASRNAAKLNKSVNQQASQEDNKPKRNPTIDGEKKQELKRVPSKLLASTSSKTATVTKTVTSQNTQSSQSSIKLVSQSQSSSSQVKASGLPSVKPIPSKHKASSSDKQPAQVLREQAHARVQAQIRAQDGPEGGIDEQADLPDINSEYSNSDDEDRPRSFDPPNWAQSPNLKETLDFMQTVNPDTIFGSVPKLEMEDMFPGRRKSKFRVRTSSANWAGTDGVTVEEEIAYARRMGWRE